MILDDAAAQSPFSEDPYIRQRRARSILCLPLINQGRFCWRALPREWPGPPGLRAGPDRGVEVACLTGCDLFGECNPLSGARGERTAISGLRWRGGIHSFFDLVLFRCLSRSGECRLCHAHHERSSGLVRLRLSDLAPGLFFIGYFLFEVPCNLFLERFGARVWIARIMITWGIVSGVLAFGPIGMTGIPASGVFYTLRFLLGLAEAGFFPGIILYLTLWFPARLSGANHQARSARGPDLLGNRRADLGRAPGPERLRRPGTAGNGCSFWKPCLPPCWPRHRRAVLPDRPPRGGLLARRGSAPMAGQNSPRRRSARGGGRSRRRGVSASPLSTIAFSRSSLRLFRRRGVRLRPELLAADHRQGFRPSHRDDRDWVTIAIPYIVGFGGMRLVGAAIGSTGERSMHLAVAQALAAIGHRRFGLPRRPGDEDDSRSRPSGPSACFASQSIFWTPARRRSSPARRSRCGIAAINSIGNLAGFFGPFVDRLDQGRDRRLRFAACDDAPPCPAIAARHRAWRSATTGGLERARRSRRNDAAPGAGRPARDRHPPVQ